MLWVSVIFLIFFFYDLLSCLNKKECLCYLDEMIFRIADNLVPCNVIIINDIEIGRKNDNFV